MSNVCSVVDRTFEFTLFPGAFFVFAAVGFGASGDDCNGRFWLTDVARAAVCFAAEPRVTRIDMIADLGRNNAGGMNED